MKWFREWKGRRRTREAAEALKVSEFVIRENTTKMVAQHPAFTVMAEALADLLHKQAAKNYVSMEAFFKGEGYTITVQKSSGMSPAARAEQPVRLLTELYDASPRPRKAGEAYDRARAAAYRWLVDQKVIEP